MDCIENISAQTTLITFDEPWQLLRRIEFGNNPKSLSQHCDEANDFRIELNSNDRMKLHFVFVSRMDSHG